MSKVTEPDAIMVTRVYNDDKVGKGILEKTEEGMAIMFHPKYEYDFIGRHQLKQDERPIDLDDAFPLIELEESEDFEVRKDQLFTLEHARELLKALGEIK